MNWYTAYECGVTRRKREVEKNGQKNRNQKKEPPSIKTRTKIQYNQKKRTAENNVQRIMGMGTIGKIKLPWTEIGEFRLMVDSVSCDPGWLDVTTVSDCQQAADILQLEYAGEKVLTDHIYKFIVFSCFLDTFGGEHFSSLQVFCFQYVGLF